jgi:hypothetical protein
MRADEPTSWMMRSATTFSNNKGDVSITFEGTIFVLIIFGNHDNDGCLPVFGLVSLLKTGVIQFEVKSPESGVCLSDGTVPHVQVEGLHVVESS